MLTNFLSTTKPVNSVFIIALFLCYTVIGFSIGRIDVLTVNLFLWFLLLFVLVNFVNSRNSLTSDNSYFFLFFVFLTGYFPDTIHINAFFYSNLILIVYIRRVYSLQSPKNTLKKLFDSGFWLGISFLTEPFSIIFFLMIFLSLTIHQHIDYRRLFTPVLGFFIPVILYFTYCFWYNNLECFYALFDWDTNYNFSFYNSLEYKVLSGFIFLFIFISLLLKSSKTFNVKSVFQKNWTLVFIHFLLSALLVTLVKTRNGSEILYLFFPSAIILANGFELFQKKWYADIIILLFFFGLFIPYFS